MIITCEQRHSIGYIYLQKPNLEFCIWEDIENREIEKYLDGVKPKIMVEDGNKGIEDRIKGLKISDKNYLEDLNRKFTEEYLNDKDKRGYIVGIELDISKENLVESIKEQVYKIHMVSLQQQEYMLLTLAGEGKVFDQNNILYAANTNNDTYYIVSIEDDIVYIMGLLTRRLDLYPIDYIKEPNFILN